MQLYKLKRSLEYLEIRRLMEEEKKFPSSITANKDDMAPLPCGLETCSPKEFSLYFSSLISTCPQAFTTAQAALEGILGGRHRSGSSLPTKGSLDPASVSCLGKQ